MAGWLIIHYFLFYRKNRTRRTWPSKPSIQHWKTSKIIILKNCSKWMRGCRELRRREMIATLPFKTIGLIYRSWLISMSERKRLEKPRMLTLRLVLLSMRPRMRGPNSLVLWTNLWKCLILEQRKRWSKIKTYKQI